MYNKTIIIIGIVLLIATMSFVILHERPQSKFCDSAILYEDYDEEFMGPMPRCYEVPKEFKEQEVVYKNTKLVEIKK